MMNSMQAALQKAIQAQPSDTDDPKKRLLARLALAEREYTQGKFRPADDVVADLRAANRA